MSEIDDIASPPVRQRLSPERRRQQLIQVAYRILAVEGPEGMQISEVAAQAGVSRPLVYRFFANRTDLLVAVLDDFERSLSARFRELAQGGEFPDDPREIAAMFVHSSCDLIEERGGGVWDLLMSRSSDKEVVQFSKEVLQRLMEPWYEPLRVFLGNSLVPATVVADMLIGAGDVALNHWVHGRISRTVAVDACVTSIAGILVSFTTLQQNSVTSDS